jgi:hypothetical protein
MTVCSFLFQDFIIKYRKLVKDIDDVRCAPVVGDENSLTQVSIAMKPIDLCSIFLIKCKNNVKGIVWRFVWNKLMIE